MTVLGGYGVFGRRVSSALATLEGVRVRVVGRDPKAGSVFSESIGAEFRQADVIHDNSLREALAGSHLVIHSAGPFQGQDYRVAEMCLEAGSHYLDLADSRQFVTGIGALHEAAQRKKLFVSSGVSSVPAITHAMITAVMPEFSSIDEIKVALSPGNQNPRGAATIAAILSYLGRPIEIWQEGQWITRPGWGDAHWMYFPSPVGKRRVHNCDVPDVALFPAEFGAQTVRFYAGVELNAINYTLSALGRLRKHVAMKSLPEHAGLFLRASLLLFSFGTKNGALSVGLRGKGLDGAKIERRIAIVTEDDGPATPSSASIVLAKKILRDGPSRVGAFPCMGFLTLEEIMTHLRPLGIRCVTTTG